MGVALPVSPAGRGVPVLDADATLVGVSVTGVSGTVPDALAEAPSGSLDALAVCDVTDDGDPLSDTVGDAEADATELGVPVGDTVADCESDTVGVTLGSLLTDATGVLVLDAADDCDGVPDAMIPGL